MIAVGFHSLFLVICFFLARGGWAMASDSASIYDRFGSWIVLPGKLAVPFIRIVGRLWTVVFGLGVVAGVCLIPVDLYHSLTSH